MHFLSLLTYFAAVFAKGEVDQASSPPLRCSSSAFSAPKVGRGLTILSVQAQAQHNYTSIPGGPLQPSLHGLNFCQVQVYLSHRTPNDGFDGKITNDRVLVEIWLPLSKDDWNGRFQVTGGAGFATGMFGAHLGVAVKHGWAAVSTDGGHDADLEKLSDASWVLPAPEGRHPRPDSYLRREVAWDLLHNFAGRSSVDQILVGKSIIRQYYGTHPHHSYWNGCSTGGRQGYYMAQKYPELLDGILANAPAINFVNLLMAELWPQQAMKMADTFLSNCELEYFRMQAIKHCELDENVNIGYLLDPLSCHWHPSSLIGNTFLCDGHDVTVTREMAQVVQDIQTGPGGSSSENMFPGLSEGVPMTTLADIEIDQNGMRMVKPFRIAASWLQKVVLQDRPIYGALSDKRYFDSLWISAQSEFGGLLNTNDPDLSRLRDSGAKLLTWHGIHDQMIPFRNTINYRRTVEATMGGAHGVDDYYRVFLAPGVEHCGGGVGPIPIDPLESLVRWVEENEPPDTLDAETVDQEGDFVTRELCLWPGMPKYMGIGDVKRASSWSCVGSTERPVLAEQEIEKDFDYGTMQQPQRSTSDPDADTTEGSPGRPGQILGGLKDRLQGLGMGLRVE
tara:strand:- start:8823 stop:10679 length:1857 start_codon:yes stop_codon:yes gene_type:complete